MDSVEAVEKILNYSFTNKTLLKEAITQTSCGCMESSPLFKRLEFLGDSVLEVAFTNYIYLTYPNLEFRELYHLRAPNVSNEKFARVAVNHNLYQFLIRDNPSPSFDETIREFTEAVGKEDDPAPYGELVKAPKILADIVESIAGAVYIDVNFDLQRFWEIFRGLLEPIYKLDDIREQPEETFLALFRLGDKHGKRIDFRYYKGDRKEYIVEVYLDDKCIAASRHAKRIDRPKLLAAKEALQKLSECMPIEKIFDEDNLDFDIEDVKRKLVVICSTEKHQLQTGSSSLPTTSENPLLYEMTPNKTVIDDDSLHVELEDVKRKLFEICSAEKLQLKTGSPSFPTTSENSLTYIPTKTVIGEDSPHVEPEDVKGKSFEICSTEKLQLQTELYSLPTASENPLADEMTQEEMVIDEDSPHVEPEDAKVKSLEIFSSRKLQIQTGSSSLPTASENPLIYEMTTKQMVADKDSLETGREPKRKLIIICAKKKWPKPIFSVVEERGPENEQKFVCSVKIEIPTIESTFHMKGDAKSTKKQAENSSAYHMISALKSSLMSLVISNLQMANSLDKKKNPSRFGSEMDSDSVEAVEKILNYSFVNKNLLKEALTHNDLPLYKRLVFIGGPALSIAFTNHICLMYPTLETSELYQLRAGNTSNDRYARVAVKKGIHQFFIRNDLKSERRIVEFIELMGKEDDPDPDPYRFVEAPKDLAILVDVVAGAVYIDVNYNVQRLWEIVRGLFEPIYTLDDLRRQAHPLLTLLCLGVKHGKRIEFRYGEKGMGINAQVYIDDKFIACGCSNKNRSAAKTNAAKAALQKLSETMPIEMVMNENIEYEDAKEKLIEICNKRKWPNPIYDSVWCSEKGFVCSAKIETPTEEGTLCIEGDYKKSEKDSGKLFSLPHDKSLESPLTSLVISNLKMQESLDEKKNLQIQESLDEKKNLQMQKSLDEKKNLKMPESLDENKNRHSKKRKRRR